ncbi:MAG: PEP-CTERM sorting domain-containing protein [Pirellulales bacterium]|nr:PEP-CTERM sorting domain-containing protein [Pirellulales bacterium]
MSGADNWDYGLAWRMSTLFDQPSADFDDDGTVSGSDFLAWQRNFGRLLGAAHADGDADGDGDVDSDDLAVYQQATVGGSAPLAGGPPGGTAGVGALLGAVPEPTTFALAAGGALLWGASRLRRRTACRRSE